MFNKTIKRIFSTSPRSTARDPGGERPAEWYNQVFADPHFDYSGHYTESRYYFMWSVIARRIHTGASILEIGCGPGQFAHLLFDRGVRRYVGFDFSEQAIAMARATCPDLRFEVADVFTTNLFEVDYDTVICTEVLEHLERDLAVLERIKPGTRCIITVPNFPYVSHVRHFLSESAVADRYGSYFSEFKTDNFLKSKKGDRHFLLDGIRR